MWGHQTCVYARGSICNPPPHPSGVYPPPLLIHQGGILGEFYVELLAWGLEKISSVLTHIPSWTGSETGICMVCKARKRRMGRGVQLYMKPKSEGTNSLDPRWRGEENNEKIFKCIAERPEFKVQVSRCPSSESKGESLERPESKDWVESLLIIVFINPIW